MFVWYWCSRILAFHFACGWSLGFLQITWLHEISKSLRFKSMNMYKWSQPESSQGFWSYQPTWRREASGLRFVDLSECRSLTAPTVAGTALRCLHNVAVGGVWRLHLRIVWGTCQWRSWSFTNAEGGTSRAGDCMVDALSTAHRTGVDEWWPTRSWNFYEFMMDILCFHASCQLVRGCLRYVVFSVSAFSINLFCYRIWGIAHHGDNLTYLTLEV